jgi:hypothetical protein
VFRSAGKTGIDVTARLVTREPEDIVVGAYGLRLLSDAVYRPGQADALLVAGGGWATRAEAGAWAEVQRGDWMPLLWEAARTARIIGAPAPEQCCWPMPASSARGAPERTTPHGMTWPRPERR